MNNEQNIPHLIDVVVNIYKRPNTTDGYFQVIRAYDPYDESNLRHIMHKMRESGNYWITCDESVELDLFHYIACLDTQKLKFRDSPNLVKISALGEVNYSNIESLDPTINIQIEKNISNQLDPNQEYQYHLKTKRLHPIRYNDKGIY
ncbi:hypothetical protein O1Q79_01886 [Lonepinella sp. MS14434]|uniref:hypothetical protein n=1 Tax=Lonepinella sp. MS14434 TaxID=3003617 RepID=UPI0036DD0F51